MIIQRGVLTPFYQKMVNEKYKNSQDSSGYEFVFCYSFAKSTQISKRNKWAQSGYYDMTQHQVRADCIA